MLRAAAAFGAFDLARLTPIGVTAGPGVQAQPRYRRDLMLRVSFLMCPFCVRAPSSELATYRCCFRGAAVVVRRSAGAAAFPIPLRAPRRATSSRTAGACGVRKLIGHAAAAR